jgi:hypothetical protein
MDNVTFIKITGLDGVEQEHAIIDHGNEQFTSMLKSTYDEQQAQAEHFTPMVTDETASI